MANIIKCAACDTILRTFNDDCPTCLEKENALKVRPETELLFPKEKEIRERDEKRRKRKK